MFTDDMARQREMRSNGHKIDAWRKTDSYKLYVKVCFQLLSGVKKNSLYVGLAKGIKAPYDYFRPRTSSDEIEEDGQIV